MKSRLLSTLLMLSATFMTTGTTYAEGTPKTSAEQYSFRVLQAFDFEPVTYNFTTNLALSAVFSGYVDSATAGDSAKSPQPKDSGLLPNPSYSTMERI